MREITIKYTGGPPDLDGHEEVIDLDDLEYEIHDDVPEGVYVIDELWSKGDKEYVQYKYVTLPEWAKLDPEADDEDAVQGPPRTVWYYLKKLWKGR